MTSVAYLTRPHADAQTDWVARSRATLADVMFLDDEAVANAPITPSEGSAVDAADGAWLSDGFGTARAWHDVWPERELPRAHAPAQQIAANIESELRRAGVWSRMARQPGGSHDTPLHEHLLVANGTMPLDIVNIVHTSYCATRHGDGSVGGGAADEAAEDLGNANTADAEPRRPTLITHNWMWRRLMHLGCQQNHVHTSIKICYAPPFNASHLVFQTCRILETGASNLAVASVMLQHGTLAHLAAAGAAGALTLASRVPQNMVATSRMPRGQVLDLALLKWRYPPSWVHYRPRCFAGAVIKHPSLSKIMLLAFSGGAVVCVGSKSLEGIRRAYETVHPMLATVAGEPADLGAGHGPAGKRRKRKRDTCIVAGDDV